MNTTSLMEALDGIVAPQCIADKHAGLEALIAEERARPSPNDSVLKELKRRKLKIKEELSRLH